MKLEDKDMLRKIGGPDGNECTDMIAGHFRYHRDYMNLYLKRRVDTQEKSSTDTIPCDAGLTQSCIGEPLVRDGAIFFVTASRDEFRKYLKIHRTELCLRKDALAWFALQNWALAACSPSWKN